MASSLPKIEDRIDIVQDKYDSDFGHAKLRTNEHDLPVRLPGFYRHGHELRGDDYELIVMDNEFGKQARNKSAHHSELHDHSVKFLTKQSLDEHTQYSQEVHHPPQDYRFHSHLIRFEDRKNAVMESLAVLKVANRRLEAYDREIHRLSKLSSKSSAGEVSRPPTGRRSPSSGFCDDISAELSLDSLRVQQTTDTIHHPEDYHWYNADMKRIHRNLHPALDGAPVLKAPNILDPAEVQAAYVLKHYGSSSVMNVQPHSHYEISETKEIAVAHMESVVFRGARKYGFMFDRRRKLRQRRKARNIGGSPNRLSPVSKPTTMSHHRGHVHPLQNTRHGSLIGRDLEQYPVHLDEFRDESQKSKPVQANHNSSAAGQGRDTPSPPPIKSPTPHRRQRSVALLLPQLSGNLEMTLANISVDEDRPLSARSHKTDVFAAEPPPLSEQLPMLRRSLSSTFKAPSRSGSRADMAPLLQQLQLNTPELGHAEHRMGSPSAFQSEFHTPGSRGMRRKSLFTEAVPEAADELEKDTKDGDTVPDLTATVSGEDIVPFVSKRSQQRLQRAISRGVGDHSPLAVSLARTVTPPPQADHHHSPVKVATPLVIPFFGPNSDSTSHSNSNSRDEAEVQPGHEYLTMMVRAPSRKMARQPSVAFSFDSVTGRITDIHYQSLRPKQRPRSADLDKSTQRNLLIKLRSRADEAFKKMRRKQRAVELHHGKDLSKITRISEADARRERDALIHMYRTCDGDNWTRRDNWCSDRPVKEWFGVFTTVEGYIFELHLGHNNLTGPFPDQIMFFPQLEVLDVDNNQLIGDLPEYALQKCPKLCVLSARHNQLTGTLQLDLLSHLTCLKEIWLCDNQLVGELQDGLCALSALTHLDLDNNNFSGQLPRHIAKLFHLQYLSLGRNRFTGHIPPGIMSLDRLETLSVYSNRLTGHIPLWIKSMPSLQDLLLFDNDFSEEK